ncbi:hypothetical protein [Streptomyces sp. NBC_00503]|uniref:hypothetical protein n=1 Tax=Streptomyces sp. NBC_00503 TaxID=2903659 RepID=UPI002E814BE8|nr:hypothetical protein [Streptomyces sp. NBC_00503]WUD81416.1 hypothetical protein OG490_13190 [Streptomyces sp. NBC_00503]
MGDRVLKARNRRGRWATCLGVFAAALWLGAGGLLAAQPAQAATGGCAGDLVRTLPFSTGEVRVYKTRDRACAVAVAREPGARRPMSVSIQPRGGSPVRDAGQFARYAGPVTAHAIARCVYVKGSVGAGSVDSGWILC